MSQGSNAVLFFGGVGTTLLGYALVVVRDRLRVAPDDDRRLLKDLAKRVQKIEEEVAVLKTQASLSEEARELLSSLREQLAGVSSIVNLLGRSYFGTERWDGSAPQS